MTDERVRMTKKLSEMNLAELWQLFPIFLVPYHEEWGQWYEEEAQILKNNIPQEIAFRLSHIGSTALKGILAKNIVDLLLEVKKEEDLSKVKKTLLLLDWRLMSEDACRLSFNKGYTEEGFAPRVFHLHLRLQGDHDELYFRDYLREHPVEAKAYERLKESLAKIYPNDRDGYTRAKTHFINRVTQLGKKTYKDRYEKK